MKAETKIYSDSIKRNNIVVSKDCFSFYIDKKLIVVTLTQDDDGKWFAENEDKCHTKKAAVYFYVKKYYNNL